MGPRIWGSAEGPLKTFAVSLSVVLVSRPSGAQPNQLDPTTSLEVHFQHRPALRNMAPTQTLQGITAQLRNETSATPNNIYKAIWQNKKLLLISAFAS